MSLIVARRKRTALYLSIIGVAIMVAAVMAISASDPGGVSLRIGMVMVTVGAAMFLPWYQLVPAIILTWFLPDTGRSLVGSKALFNFDMMLELPCLLGLGAFATFARESLSQLEQEMVMVGGDRDATSGLDLKTGVFQESRLGPDLSAELARSRRFGRSFAFVLVGIDDMRQRFDYRDEESWDASLKATADLLRGTRNNVDRVYQYGTSGYALLLPESGERDVKGLVRRLRRTARKAKPSEGEAGGPFAVHYGATFFPACATSTEDLMRRAEIAMRIAEKSPDHLKIDTAAAPEMAPGETLRRNVAEEPDAAEVSEAATRLNLEPQARQLHILSETDGDALEGMDEAALEAGVAPEPVSVEESAPVAPMTVAPVAETPVAEAETPAVVATEAPQPVEAEQPEPSIWDEVEAEPALAPVIAFEPRVAAEPASEPATAEQPQPVAEPVMAEASEPEPVAVAVQAPVMVASVESPEAKPEAETPASFDDEIAGLLAHLDETLDMIRTMKSTAA